MRFLLMFAMLLSSFAIAQEPDQKFWDRQMVASQTANFGIRLMDVVRTCQLPGREVMGPWQSCGGVAVWVMSGVAVSNGGSYFLEKHGYRKLAHITPWLFWAADSYSVAYTFAHEKPRHGGR